MTLDARDGVVNLGLGLLGLLLGLTDRIVGALDPFEPDDVIAGRVAIDRADDQRVSAGIRQLTLKLPLVPADTTFSIAPSEPSTNSTGDRPSLPWTLISSSWFPEVLTLSW